MGEKDYAFVALEAAECAGGKRGLVGYLQNQAKENPTAFMTLLGRVLPTQLSGAGRVVWS